MKLIDITQFISVNDDLCLNKNVSIMISNIQNIIQKTLISYQTYKKKNILTSNDINIAHESLRRIYNDLNKMNELTKTKIDTNLLTKLQTLMSDISLIIKSYGTNSIDDLLYICLGPDYIEKHISKLDKLSIDKFNLIKMYAKPFGYKNVQIDSQNNTLQLNKHQLIFDEAVSKNTSTMDTFEITTTNLSFVKKVYGLNIAFRAPDQHKILIVSCIIDDILIDCTDSCFLNAKIEKLNTISQTYQNKEQQSFIYFIHCMNLKDLLVYSEDFIKDKFNEYFKQSSIIKNTPLAQVVKDFINGDLYYQRCTLIQLLLRTQEQEFHYLAHILFDILTTEENRFNDARTQTNLFDSLPWNCKIFLRETINKAIQHNLLTKYDNNLISLEQQICLMNTNISVKEKAMIKLKEVKSKSDDSGSKSKQYLEGLLRIPFGIFRNEPILNKISENNSLFLSVVNNIQSSSISIEDFPIKLNYTNIEVRKFSQIVSEKYILILKDIFTNLLLDSLTTCKRNKTISIVQIINSIINKHLLNKQKLNYNKKTLNCIKNEIANFINSSDICLSYLLEISNYCSIQVNFQNSLNIIDNNLKMITENSKCVEEYMIDISKTLNKSVYGHNKAKRQIERIVGQWINGEKSGYCFGFEGPPGVGKTSLAKNGIAQCLKDNCGSNRPFTFIAIGGSTNSATIDGHNYTYVGSSWGRIVDILMESKCMNPIIFIDELDKVSKTEHGKEIIGILTHLIDPTQNDAFQDKYFAGIDLDLSKALFIFSYNDANLIDKILLDRIHRIKFDHLTNNDKLIITKKYLLPDIFKKMGMLEMIEICDDVILHIICNYTREPGVRKLKELLFEIIGEINLEILQNLSDKEFSIPLIITQKDISDKYLKDNYEFKVKKIHLEPKIGLITGLWANSVGQGGVLPIEGSWMPTTTFLDLKLTGMQGDVMKESMNVSKTLAYNLASKYFGQEKMADFINKKENTKMQGIHVHVPEGSTPKDGPSAGVAITVVLYSLITNRKIKHDIAITGEICLQGNITAIGGLDLKILGGISSGVKMFIYPKENSQDFITFSEKYFIDDSIKFVEVSNIQEVFELVFVD